MEQTGYLWYLKAESETRLRFEDYLEMAMVEGEMLRNAASAKLDDSANAGITDFNAANAALLGTQGLFAAIVDQEEISIVDLLLLVWCWCIGMILMQFLKI